MDALAAAFPIGLLIYLMVKKRPLPAGRALPVAALVLYLLQLAWFRAAPNVVHAAVLEGLLTALTPILIVWGRSCSSRPWSTRGPWTPSEPGSIR